jgi:cell division protein FtsB
VVVSAAEADAAVAKLAATTPPLRATSVIAVARSRRSLLGCLSRIPIHPFGVVTGLKERVAVDLTGLVATSFKAHSITNYEMKKQKPQKLIQLPCISSDQWGGVGQIIPWWARLDLNQRPSGYEPPALTAELRARDVRISYYILVVMKVPKFTLTGSSLVNVIGSVIIIYLGIQLGQTIKSNYDLGLQIQELKSQIGLLQSQKQQLNYNIQYYNTDTYRDRQARSTLGLQLPGENVIIIPNDTPAPVATYNTSSKSTAPKSNLQQWLSFLGGAS